MSQIGRLLALLLLVSLASCGKPLSPLPNDAYIWQRRWTPAVTTAMRDSRSLVSRWHVLASEWDGESRWHDTAPDPHALATAGAPVVAVFRIDGQLVGWDEAAVAAHITNRLDAWKRSGITVSGVEIDYDCGTGSLAAYTRFLAMLHTHLAPGTQMSITALPAWLDSSALDALLATADEAVLQVHAVQNPVQGLFDPIRARAWVAAFATHTRRPWRIALPAYGSRVTWDNTGRVAGVESERPLLLADGLAHELLAPPETIRQFVMQIERDRPHGLAGFVWFRLPTEADQRAWSLTTWRAVLARAALNVALAAYRRPGGAPGLYDVVLASSGNSDATLPPVVRVPASCAAADGINGYVLDYDARGTLLRRAQPGLLHAGAQRDIGWLRCDDTHSSQVTLNVEP